MIDFLWCSQEGVKVLTLVCKLKLKLGVNDKKGGSASWKTLLFFPQRPLQHFLHFNFCFVVWEWGEGGKGVVILESSYISWIIKVARITHSNLPFSIASRMHNFFGGETSRIGELFIDVSTPFLRVEME